jgi:hypothetical protein
MEFSILKNKGVLEILEELDVEDLIEIHNI